MDLSRFLPAQGADADHARVFERFRIVLAALLLAQRCRPAPRIVNPFEWMDR